MFTKEELQARYHTQVARMHETIMSYITTYQPTYYDLPHYIKQTLWFLVEQVANDLQSEFTGKQIDEMHASSAATVENMVAFLEYDQKVKQEIEALKQELEAQRAVHYHPIDDEITSVLSHHAPISVQEVKRIHAKVAGSEDMHWIIETQSATFFYIYAHLRDGNVETCTGRQDESAEKAAYHAPVLEGVREIRASLLAQVHGEKPYEYVSFLALSQLMKEKTEEQR